MLESLEIIKNTFLQYKGTGAYIVLYLLALLYLFLKEEKKEKRMFFLYFQILLWFVVLSPFFNKLVGKIFEESTYWRVYWIIPLGVTMAYVGVEVIINSNSKMKQVISTIIVILIIIMSGKFIYTKENYVKVGNVYKLPDEHVLIAQLIAVDEREYKKALVPETLTPHIRQIESSVKLAYKRNPVGYAEGHIVYELNAGNVENVVTYARKNSCNYIVFKKSTALNGDMSEYGYNLLTQTPNYDIYVYEP